MKARPQEPEPRGSMFGVCDHCGCHTIPAIAALTAEHDAILSLAWQLSQAPEPCAPAVRDQLEHLLRTHSIEEEAALYPLLVASGDLSLDVRYELEHEHRKLATSLAANTFDTPDYFMLAAHIEAEETELFPAAMFAFDDHDWETYESMQREVTAENQRPVDGPNDLAVDRHGDGTRSSSDTS